MAEPPHDSPLPPTVLSGPPPLSGGVWLAGQKLGTRYTILSLLGRGGMGSVYKAWDEELGEQVAIKTILLNPGTDPGTAADLERRFKREVQLARQITHRNVVRIHDVGEVEGLRFLTMAFVEGETLAAVMRRTGPMPVREMLALARQIADGLTAAHAVGVVHRDLKPENVMVTPGGQVLLMDFGIARSSRTTATNSGAVVGTMEYMAPEQTRAGGGVDERADIYAFGLMCRDMLAGRNRLNGVDQPLLELMGRLQRSPDPPRSTRPDVPEALDAIIVRAMAAAPDARFASSVELVAALAALAADGHPRRDAAAPTAPRRLPLRPLAAAAVILAVTAGAATLWLGGRDASPPRTQAVTPLTVLVADFANRTGDPVFDGLVGQALAVGLESASFINVYPRQQVLRAAGMPADLTVGTEAAQLIALREGVPFVIAGAVEPGGAGYRLSVNVIKSGSANESVLTWATEAQRKDDVLNAVGRMAAQVRSSLGDVSVDPNNVRVDETFTAASLDAAAEYVRGQNLLAAGRADAALDAYRKAVTLDPGLGRAWSGMGGVANNQRRRDEAEKYYAEALKRTDRMTDREKYRTRGAYYSVTGNVQAGRDELEALVKQFPSDAAGLSNLALTHFNAWEFAEAMRLGKQAADLYPKNVLRQSNLALYALYAGDLQTAARQAALVLSINKDYPYGHLTTALTEAIEGRLDQAEQAFAGMRGLAAPGPGFAAHGLADLGRYRGRLADASRVLEAAITAESSASAKARLVAVLASARAAQGDGPAALRLLATASLDSADAGTLVEAGEAYLAAGRLKDASAMADRLAGRVGPAPEAFAAVLRGQIALARKEPRVAQELLLEARRRTDAWLVRYWLGRAYLAMGSFAEADSEFDVCLRRRSEAAAVFIDDYPTLRRLPEVHYYQGLARDGLKSPGAVDSFKAFLAPKENGDETGGLVADARRRIAAR